MAEVSTILPATSDRPNVILIYADDNEERHDLAAKYPEKVAALKKILQYELDSARPDLAD